MKSATRLLVLDENNEVEAQQEREGLAWCERLGRKMDRKRSKGKTRRGTYDNRNR